MLEMLEDNALILCAILSVVVACILLMATISVLRRIKRLQPRRTASAVAGSPALQAVQDAPFAALLTIDPSQRCVCAVSGPFEALTGIPAQQILSDAYSLDGCFHKDTRRNLREAFDLWDRRSLLQIRCDIENAQTKLVRHCSFKVWPSDTSGLWVAELRDITEVADLIEGLERKAEEAEASEKAKLRFLSDMSHEIRTPMNGIMGTLALAQIHADEPDATREYLHQADDLTQYLLSIINNVLDISKIENGKMELEDRCFSLNDLLKRERGLFAESTKTKGIQYTVEGDDLEDPYVVGDELRLAQVITNLVSNAQKFTPAGGSITVSLLHVQSTEDHLHFVIRVADTGKGMNKEFLKTIFDPFSQESSSTSRQFGGTGLGMAISDQIVRLMGGYIVVESELGQGTTFEIYLGLPMADEAQIADYQAEQQSVVVDSQAADAAEKLFRLEGSTILMAEDNMLNAGIAEEMLLEMGVATVDHALDGQIACDLFAASEAGTYSIILMDIQMPNMNGREAAQTIRAMDHPDARSIPIIALSADAYVEDKRASRKAGMNGHISKPIVYETLEAQICAELASPGLGVE